MSDYGQICLCGERMVSDERYDALRAEVEAMRRLCREWIAATDSHKDFCPKHNSKWGDDQTVYPCTCGRDALLKMLEAKP